MQDVKIIVCTFLNEGLTIRRLFERESYPVVRMLVLASMAIALMVADHFTQGLMRTRAVLSVPLSSIQYIVSTPIRLVNEWGAAVGSREQLIEERQSLRAEQLLLRARVQQLVALESENRQLKALLHAAKEAQGRVLAAGLLAVDTDPFVHRVTLDRGRRDGLFVGQPVLDAYGVMGQVVMVNPTVSQVLLINDAHSGIPVEDVRSGLRAIAVGDQYTGKLRLVNVTQTADIRAGDLLITSGLGNHYPHGYPVGQVESVHVKPGEPFAIIALQPMAHLERSRQVLLLWPATGRHKS